MQLANMYQKPINRPIDSVIRASDVEQDRLKNELDEYIFTPDIISHLEGFFDEYNNPDATSNGAWISGFFGSGKSHLLKIMAVALEDREVDGVPALDYLLPKLDDEPYLKGQMETARKMHPSESVLFNVDIMAENTGQDSAGAMLSAFIRAFNAHCGYFDGSQQYIAQMEYDLDSEGKLDDFKQAVFEQVGKTWDNVRTRPTFYSSKISTAYDAVCGNAPGTNMNIIKHYQDDYRPSIDAFASRVRDYIDAHGRGFRLNFFVDEVGQFIANDSNRMLNLQSIVEELNTKCGGSSWVIVTSQEDVGKLTGRLSEGSANDFSKIQGRFQVRMSLRSEDAEDIIKRRLLAKTDDAKAEIIELYDKRGDNFSYLFGFRGGRNYGSYEDEDDFVDTYPFVRYQFSLFIQVMRTLSDHDAMQGRYEATGARSMLGVFQDVAIGLATSNVNDVGEQEPLAAFDAMFDGLRDDIKSEYYGQVSQAERNLKSNPLAIRVLKVLLLIKYCDEIPATQANLRVLLLDSLNQDPRALESDIKSALDVLESERYIRRNAESGTYEYLTNEEKAIESEILNETLESGARSGCIKDLCDSVIGSLRTEYRHEGFKNNYYFDLKVDEELKGQKRYDLAIDIRTLPAVEGGDTLLVQVPSEPRTLSIQLRDDEDFLKELEIYLKTKKYVNASNTSSNNESRRIIVENRGIENRKRYEKLQDMFRDLLTDASYYAAGADITDSVNGSGAERVRSGMCELVGKTYSQLQLLRTTVSNDDVYWSCLNGQQSIDGTGLPQDAQAVLNQTRLFASAGGATVGGDGATSLIHYFERGEYGWPDVVTRNAVALLSAKGLVEVRQAGKQLEGEKLADKLKNKRELDKLTVREVKAVDEHTLESVRKAYKDIVGTSSNAGNDAKAMAKELSAYLANELDSLVRLQEQANHYPFEQRFEADFEKLDQARKNLDSDWNWITGEQGFLDKAGELKDAKDDLDKMQGFLTGSRHTIFDSIRDFCNNSLDEARELHLSALDDERAVATMCDLMDDEECYKSRNLHTANDTLRAIQKEMDAEKQELRQRAESDLKTYQSSFEESYDIDGLGAGARRRFDAIFDEGTDELARAQKAYQLKSFMDDFQARHGDEIIQTLMPPEPEPESEPEPATAAQPTAAQAYAVPQPSAAPKSVAPTTMRLSNIKAKGYTNPTITTAADVDKYLAALREELLAEIEAGHVIMK